MDGRLLTGVTVLDAVIESGGFSRAGEALGISPSGVSHAIARLEARLGVRLLDRTTRAVALTDEGRRFYARVRPSLDEIEEFFTSAQNVLGNIPIATYRPGPAMADLWTLRKSGEALLHAQQAAGAAGVEGLATAFVDQPAQHAFDAGRSAVAFGVGRGDDLGAVAFEQLDGNQ